MFIQSHVLSLTCQPVAMSGEDTVWTGEGFSDTLQLWSSSFQGYLPTPGLSLPEIVTLWFWEHYRNKSKIYNDWIQLFFFSRIFSLFNFFLKINFTIPQTIGNMHTIFLYLVMESIDISLLWLMICHRNALPCKAL